MRVAISTDGEYVSNHFGRIDDAIDKLVKGTLKGGESLCKPGAGKGYGLDKTQCDHPHKNKKECDH